MAGGGGNKRLARPQAVPGSATPKISHRRLSRAEQNAAFLAGLPLLSFDLILADNPWRFRVRSEATGLAKSPQAHYRVMTIAELAALGRDYIRPLAAPDSVLVMCATWPLLLGGDERGRMPGNAHASPVGEVIDAFGFRYVTGGAWVKRTANGKTAFGTGYRARSATEPFLIAVRGSPLNSRAMRNLIEAIETDNAVNGVRREHSRKPEELYAWCEAYLPGARRLDLFSRTSRPGWTAAGDETGKFD